jgi:hypothetical protein
MILFKNNASSRLSQAALAAATTIHVGTGEGVEFPALSGDDYFFATILAPDASYEIVKCVNVLGDSLIITRGQQGTVPLDFPVNSLVEIRWTAEQAQTVSNYVPPRATEVVYGTVRKATAQEIEDGTGDGVVSSNNLAVALADLSITGAVLAFASTTAPDGWLVANGASISTITYAALFQKIGYTYGGSGTTFNIPDLRGLFIRGVGGDASAQGTKQTDAIRNITGSVRSHLQVFSEGGGACYVAGNQGWSRNPDSSNGYSYFFFDASRTVPTAIENRPVNMSMIYCIKY